MSVVGTHFAVNTDFKTPKGTVGCQWHILPSGALPQRPGANTLGRAQKQTQTTVFSEFKRNLELSPCTDYGQY